MHVFYTPRYYAEIGAGHVFPIRKFELVRNLSIEGLRARDEFLLRECYEREVPVVTVMSGGYGEDINDTIEIHCNTIRMVKEVFETPVATRRLA